MIGSKNTEFWKGHLLAGLKLWFHLLITKNAPHVKWHNSDLFFRQWLVYTTSKCHKLFFWQSGCREYPGGVLSAPAADGHAVLTKDGFDCPAHGAAAVCNTGPFWPPASAVPALLLCIELLRDPSNAISSARRCMCLIFCSPLCSMTTQRPWRCFCEICLNYRILNLIVQ